MSSSNEINTPSGGNVSDTITKVFDDLEKAEKVVVTATPPGVTTDAEDVEIMALLAQYANEVIGASDAEAQSAILVAWLQSIVSHTTSPDAQKDPELVVNFTCKGKSCVFSKKEFTQKLRGVKNAGNKNLERRFSRKRSNEINRLLNEKKLEPPMSQAAKHGAVAGMENSACDFMRLSPGEASDDFRAANALVKKSALSSRGGAGARKFLNISQIIDAAGK